MRQKPAVVKRDGEWYVIKPLFGFRTDEEWIPHESWSDALNSMLDVARVRASGGSTEKAWHPQYEGDHRPGIYAGDI